MHRHPGAVAGHNDRLGRLWRRPGRSLAALLASVALLAACGGPAPGEGAAPPQPTALSEPVPAPATAAPATAAPATAAPPTAAPATAAPATAAPATAAPPTAPAAVGGPPQGRTAEGYHVLGSPEAPVTLTMYSDFL